MHSFQPSRGRILFEVLCALTISASCAAAWIQTGASALLGAAGAATLYALVHLFDMRRREPAVAAELQRIDFVTDQPGDVSADLAADMPQVLADPLPISEVAAGEVVAPAKDSRKAKAPRKSGGRRAKTPPPAEALELAAVEERAPKPAPPQEQGESEAVSEQEATHPPLAPLFEPAPFVRQQHAVFGRKAG
jgi:hypothetical protein